MSFFPKEVSFFPKATVKGHGVTVNVEVRADAARVYRTTDANEIRDIKAGRWTLELSAEPRRKVFRGRENALRDQSRGDLTVFRSGVSGRGEWWRCSATSTSILKECSAHEARSLHPRRLSLLQRDAF